MSITINSTADDGRLDRSFRRRAAGMGLFLMALFVALVLWLLMAPATGAGGGTGPGSLGGSGEGRGGGHGSVEGSGELARDGAADAADDGLMEAGSQAMRDDTSSSAQARAAGAPTRPRLQVGFTQADAPVAPPTPPLPAASNAAAPAGGSAGGAAGGGGGSGVPSFMGVEGRGKRIAFVIDRSGSMSAGNRFAHTRFELKRSIRALGEDCAFFVIFFDSGALPMPTSAMVPATKANKDRYSQWIDQQFCGGGTDPTEAMLHALALEPDTIFLMSDGIFAEQAADAIRRANTRRCAINTIAFHDRSGEAVLQRIAVENEGSYRFVAPPSGVRTTPP